MSGRTGLLMAILTTVSGVVAITVAALLGRSAPGAYAWPFTAVVWCWLWYGETRINGGKS